MSLTAFMAAAAHWSVKRNTTLPAWLLAATSRPAGLAVPPAASTAAVPALISMVR